MKWIRLIKLTLLIILFSTNSCKNKYNYNLTEESKFLSKNDSVLFRNAINQYYAIQSLIIEKPSKAFDNSSLINVYIHPCVFE
jgi:hypothetical protein